MGTGICENLFSLLYSNFPSSQGEDLYSSLEKISTNYLIDKVPRCPTLPPISRKSLEISRQSNVMSNQYGRMTSKIIKPSFPV